MKHQSKAKPPIILTHGGAGSAGYPEEILIRRRKAISETIAQVWPVLCDGASAAETVYRAVELLEACPYFNAGLGATLQSDGMARLSASLMDGKSQVFSGVILATHMIHPSKLAYALQKKENTVIGPLGAQLLARELGIPPENPITIEQASKWVSSFQKKTPGNLGTVGAVALDQEGFLAAATSTGGSGTNTPERVSDSATVAGNYASRFAAISCTGIGEQIVNDGVAVRIETRVRDGKSIIEASDLMVQEAEQDHRKYGWIGIDHDGHWVIYCTTDYMLCGTVSQGMKCEIIE